MFKTVNKMVREYLSNKFMSDSSYRLNFDQGKKNEIQHHS
jgi:hypothetical protein